MRDMTSTNLVPLDPPAAPRWSAAVRIPIAIVAFFALLFAVAGATMAIGEAIGLSQEISQVITSVAFAAATVGLVAGLSRLDRRHRSGRGSPLAQLGFRWSGRDAVALCVGIICAIVAMVSVGAVARLIGHAVATDGLGQLSAGQLAGGFAFGLVPAFIMQGFPEELLFRGYVLNAARIRMPLAVAISSLTFGSIHVLSQSPATGVVEKFILYPLSAVALGFACCCARLGTGSLWAAVGVHGGMHMGNRLTELFATPDNYAVYLVIDLVFMTAVGVVMVTVVRRALTRRERRSKTPPTDAALDQTVDR